jgi:hypothetical protein
LTTKFKNLLGKNVSKLNINLETNEPQLIDMKGLVFESIVNPRNKTIFIRNNAENSILKEIILDKQAVMIIVKVDYSPSIKLNPKKYNEVSSSISNALQKFAANNNTVIATSLDNTQYILTSD